MTVRPILFSGSMIRAKRAGRKTQTRRVVAPANTYYDGSAWPKGRWEEMDWAAAWVDRGPYLKVPRLDGETTHRVYPKTWPDDVLWVRESWAPEDSDGWGPQPSFEYMADHPGDPSGLGWRPSIFMPRIASRFTLEVTGVKIERLQDISEADAVAEGVCQFCEDSDQTGSWDGLSTDDRAMMVRVMYGSAARAYSHLWETINGSGSWDANPWIVAVTFTVHQQNVDAYLKQSEAA